MKNKGFTLIELLAVIAIIIIIITIAIPGVTSSIKAAEKRAFISSSDKILEAAKDYSLTNKNSFQLPFDGEIKFISVADLITNKKISKTNLTGYVAIYNEGENKYEYFAYLSSDKYSVDGFSISNLGENIKVEKNQVNYTNFLNEYKMAMYSLEKETLLKGSFYTIGGTSDDWFDAIVSVEDGIIGAGTFLSNDGDFAGLNKGGRDIFIVKINNNNEIVWLRTIGGSDRDIVTGMVKISDGVVVTTDTQSTDGDFAGISRGYNDLYTVKYDFNGNLMWSDMVGGDDYEEYGSIFTVNNQVFINATACSKNGDFTGYITGTNCSQFGVNYNSDGTRKFFKIMTNGDTWETAAGASNNAFYLLGQAWDPLTVDFTGVTFIKPSKFYLAKLNMNTGSITKIDEYLPAGYPTNFTRDEILFYDDYFYVTGRTSPDVGTTDLENKHFVIYKYDYNYNLIETDLEFNKYDKYNTATRSFKCGDYICRYLAIHDKVLFQQINLDFSKKSLKHLSFDSNEMWGTYVTSYYNGSITFAGSYRGTTKNITVPAKGERDGFALKFK